MTYISIQNRLLENLSALLSISPAIAVISETLPRLLRARYLRRTIDRRPPPTEEGADAWSGPFILSGVLYFKPASKMLGKIQHFDNEPI